jgi:NADPH2:quinone reductase
MHCEGEPTEVLNLVQVPEPVATTGTLILDVEASGVGLSDLSMVRGESQSRMPLPGVPGIEVVGRVRAAGPRSTMLCGTRVLALARPPRGAYAQRVTIEQGDATPIPDTVSAAAAVALAGNYVTAYLALHERARVRRGEIVVVQGAAGGVGSAAVQLARAAGARVIGVDRGSERLQSVRALAVDLALDADEVELEPAIQAYTAGMGANIVIDTVGGKLFEDSRRYVAFEGRIVIVGFASGRIPELRVNHLILRNFTVMGIDALAYLTDYPHEHRKARHKLVQLHADGMIAPRMGAEYAFAELPTILRRIGAGDIIGQAVIRV